MSDGYDGSVEANYGCRKSFLLNGLEILNQNRYSSHCKHPSNPRCIGSARALFHFVWDVYLLSWYLINIHKPGCSLSIHAELVKHLRSNTDLMKLRRHALDCVVIIIGGWGGVGVHQLHSSTAYRGSITLYSSPLRESQTLTYLWDSLSMWKSQPVDPNMIYPVPAMTPSWVYRCAKPEKHHPHYDFPWSKCTLNHGLCKYSLYIPLLMMSF